MELLLIIFMVLVVALCAFTITTVVMDQIYQRRKNDMVEDAEDEKPAAPVEQVAPAPVQPAQPVVEPQPIAVVEEPVVAEEEPVAAEEDPDGQVVFAAVPKQTHMEKYNALSSEQKGWYDEIAAFAASRDENIKSVVTNGYEEYRYYGKRIVRFVIKRGVVICEYIIGNPDFAKYVAANKLAVKQTATTLKVTDATMVGAAKDSVDIAVNYHVETRKEAKRLERERRKEARKAAAAAKAAENAENND